MPTMNERKINLTLNEAAEVAGIPPGLLKLWIASGKFIPSEPPRTDSPKTWLLRDAVSAQTHQYFNEQDIERLTKLARKEKPNRKARSDFEDDGIQENFTVAQIASMWQLSTDKIQRLFQDEPGVVALGNKNPRGKRRRVILRIPRDVMERVKRKLSNS
jgi:hypothetical protein